MNTKKTTILIYLLLTFNAFSQNIEKFVIGAAGEIHSSQNRSINFSIGENAVETLESGNFIFYQGFHHTKKSSLLINELKKTLVHYEIYPNPTSDFFIVNLKAKQKINEVVLNLHNSKGKLIESKTIKNQQKITSIFSIKHQAKGTYFLNISNQKERLKTIQLIKN